MKLMKSVYLLGASCPLKVPKNIHNVNTFVYLQELYLTFSLNNNLNIFRSLTSISQSWQKSSNCWSKGNTSSNNRWSKRKTSSNNRWSKRKGSSTKSWPKRKNSYTNTWSKRKGSSTKNWMS